MTPYQLFAEGMNYAAHFDVPIVATMQAISNIPISDEQPVVGVPRISFTPCTTLVNLLQQSARSYVSSDFGKQVYIESISVVGQHLLNGCNDHLTYFNLYNYVNLFCLLLKRSIS